MSDPGCVPSEQLFRALAEASAALTFIYQGDANIYVNPAAEALTGYTRRELETMKFWDIIHPDSQALVRERGLARQRGEEVPPSYEVQIVTKAGETRWLDFTAHVMQLDGQSAVLGTAFDITERVQAQAALAESEAEFRRLVDNALVGVLRTRRDGRILYANRATLRIFGFETLEALQADGMLARYQHADERERLLAGLRRDGVVEYFEVGFLRRSGEAIRVVASVVLEDEVLSGMILDITERQRLEREALRGQNLDSLAVLAGGLAHDFNNFLASILTNLTLARRLPDREAASDCLVEAERAVLRARGLTDQLLTFSRGGGELRTEPVAPDALLFEAVEFAVRGSGVRVDWQLEDDLPTVLVDPGQFAQVVHNLTLNATQAMPHGGTLRVAAAHLRPTLSDETGRLQVAFEDEGPGISPADQARIFDPYFTTKPQGSGLGLASAHAILRNHGGALRVESQLGSGARFVFELPAAPDGEAPNPCCRAETSSGPPPSPRRSILVLDDDPGVLRSTELLLIELGYRVDTFKDGGRALDAHALACVDGRPHDLLLLDVTVAGGLGGIGVLERLRASGSEVPVILMSGYAPEALHERSQELGSPPLLRKPFTLEDLADHLRAGLTPG